MMKQKLISCLLFILLSTTQLIAEPESLGDLQIANAWVRAMPPGSMMTAAYANITNTTGEDVEIATFSSPQYRSVSLHQTVVDENGVSKMEEIPQLVIAAGQTVVLEPGGKHLMLMSAVDGNPDKVNIIIVYNDNNKVEVEFVVEDRG